MDLDTVADELYALPPEQFTAARNERAAQARAAGERDVATAIRRLARPTAAAWLVNQLVREHRDEIEPLLELGAGLRAATEQLRGEDLRRLSRQEHQVVDALVRQARALGNDRGHRVSDDTARGVEQTLRAALADPAAADALRAGRLTDVLVPAGFFAVSGTASAVQGDAATARRSVARGEDERERVERERVERERVERERAKREHAAAARHAETLRRKAEQARADADAAGRRRQDAEDAERRLRAECAAVQEQLAEAERALDDATRQLHAPSPRSD